MAACPPRQGHLSLRRLSDSFYGFLGRTDCFVPRRTCPCAPHDAELLPGRRVGILYVPTNGGSNRGVGRRRCVWKSRDKPNFAVSKPREIVCGGKSTPSLRLQLAQHS